MAIYPEAYIKYLLYFHADRDYFECHEVLEDHWKRVPKPERESHWVTLIQIAVALYHERRGNLKGAEILYRRLEKRIDKDQEALHALGLDQRQLHKDIMERKRFLGKQPFVDYNLPLNDQALIDECRERSAKEVKEWQKASQLEDHALVHKHRERWKEG